MMSALDVSKKIELKEWYIFENRYNILTDESTLSVVTIRCKGKLQFLDVSPGYNPLRLALPKCQNPWGLKRCGWDWLFECGLNGGLS